MPATSQRRRRFCRVRALSALLSRAPLGVERIAPSGEEVTATSVSSSGRAASTSSPDASRVPVHRAEASRPRRPTRRPRRPAAAERRAPRHPRRAPTQPRPLAEQRLVRHLDVPVGHGEQPSRPPAPRRPSGSPGAGATPPHAGHAAPGHTRPVRPALSDAGGAVARCPAGWRAARQYVSSARVAIAPLSPPRPT